MKTIDFDNLFKGMWALISIPLFFVFLQDTTFIGSVFMAAISGAIGSVALIYTFAVIESTYRTFIAPLLNSSKKEDE